VGRKFREVDSVTKLDNVLSDDAADRLERWRSAMLKTWAAGDVMVGVTKALEVSLFTLKDSTQVAKPRELANVLRKADAFARQAAHRPLTA
jgi:hypothetical protein